MTALQIMKKNAPVLETGEQTVSALLFYKQPCPVINKNGSSRFTIAGLPKLWHEEYGMKYLFMP